MWITGMTVNTNAHRIAIKFYVYSIAHLRISWKCKVFCFFCSFRFPLRRLFNFLSHKLCRLCVYVCFFAVPFTHLNRCPGLLIAYFLGTTIILSLLVSFSFFLSLFWICSSKLLYTQSFSFEHKIFALHLIFSALAQSHWTAIYAKGQNDAKAFCRTKDATNLNYDTRRKRFLFAKVKRKFSTKLYADTTGFNVSVCILKSRLFVYTTIKEISVCVCMFFNIVRLISLSFVVFFSFAHLCCCCWCCLFCWNSLSLQGSEYNCFILLSSPQLNLPWMFRVQRKKDDNNNNEQVEWWKMECKIENS